jgi:indole-3-glycerol phosphate synthase
MTTALDRIIEYKRDEVAALKRKTNFSTLEESAKHILPARGFQKQLESVCASGKNALICELKRKSPSAGEILPGANPIEIASEYEAGGAACLSILTDYPSFGGSLSDLQIARERVELPILRKDFMIDPIQIVESRAAGADCILLIMSALTDQQAAELQAVALELGLDVLTEIHDESEMDRALRLGAKLIGVNNRDLKTMITDLGVSERIAAAYPGAKLVSESGVRTPSDIARLKCSNFSMFLIGESLMKETNRENAVRALVNTM